MSHFFNLSILVQFLIESSTQLVQRISILKKKIANFQHRHSNEHGGIHLLNAIDPPVSSNRRKIDVSKQKKKKEKRGKRGKQRGHLVRNESRLSDCSVAVAKSWDYPVWGSVFGGVYIIPGRYTEKTTKGCGGRSGEARQAPAGGGGGLIDELAPGHGLITFI